MRVKLASLLSVVLLSALFLYAGLDKLFHYDGFALALRSYAVIPAWLVAALPLPVILSELWIGVGLLRPSWRRQAAAAGGLLFLVFSILLLVNERLGAEAPCGCWFTVTLAESTPLHVAQNVLLAGLAFVLWRDPTIRKPETASTSPPIPVADEG